MPERVVVSFRAIGLVSFDDQPGYLARALALKQQAEALGATLCAWSAQTFSFDFAIDEIEEALHLAMGAAEESDVPPERRFAVGISQGEMRVVGEGGSLSALSWGAPLVRATALTRAAEPGEVLLDPILGEVERGELVWRRARISRPEDGGIRGLVLDVDQPFRRIAAEAVAGLAEAPLIGREQELGSLTPPKGMFGVLRADPGMGGTRLLREWLSRGTGGRTLYVAPAGLSYEPLGALRRAFQAAIADAGEAAIDESERETLDQILSGEGCSDYAAADLVDAWLGDDGALAVDDATDVDTESLRAVARALAARGRFLALLRLDLMSVVPPALSGAQIGPTCVLPELDDAQGMELARAMTGGALEEKAAKRWARRGLHRPLGIWEALVDSILSADLAWHGDVAKPRRRSSGRGPGEEASVWLEHRMQFIEPYSRAALSALAVLGERVPAVWVRELAKTVVPGMDFDSALEELKRDRLVVDALGDMLAFSSRTVANAAAMSVPEAELAAWHRGAARIVERSGGALARAEAARHAALGGDEARAASLAVDAARSAAGVGLEQTAEQLLAFAEERDPTLASRVRAELLSDESLGAHALPRRDDSDESPALDRTELEGVPSVRIAPARGEPAMDENAMTLENPALDPQELADQLSEQAREALRRGDLDALEGAISQLRTTGERAEAVERMSGLVALGRGATPEALRRLRQAIAQDQPAPMMARARLAYGVALAGAGRHEGALLEALQALAFAREAEDQRGERAIAHFLTKLCLAAGHEGAARTWESVARDARTMFPPPLAPDDSGGAAQS